MNVINPQANVSARILIIDDDSAIREVLEAVLVDQGYAVRTAANGAEGQASLRQDGADLVLLDLRMPDVEGIDLLPQLRAIDPSLCIVMMTAFGSIKTAVESIRLGAYDFLTKPFDLDELKLTVHNALTLQLLHRENLALRSIIREQTMDFPEITGLSPRIREVFKLLKRVAAHDVTVLITGESGTGKELVARALHRSSPRKEGPFIAVNCAALPENLLETELFGHEKGAFTGAATTRPGRFELSKGGTLFLDEIGDMSPVMQAKLLRVLQEGEFERVGSGLPIKTDIRLVTATNRDLPTEVAARRFREDLYYRLNVISVHLPPLRERASDIPLLVARFLKEFGELFGRTVESIEPAAMHCLEVHSWPGNVRELKHCIEQSVLLGDGPVLLQEHLPFGLRISCPPPLTDESAISGALGELEARHIQNILRQCGWNRQRASEILGLHRNTLRDKIRRFNLVPDSTETVH